MKGPLLFMVLSLAVLCLEQRGMQAQPVPSNDLFAGRMLLEGTSALIPVNNANADTEFGEYTGENGTLLVNSVWYSWTAPKSGILHLAALPPDPDFVLSVRAYHGSTLETLVWVEPRLFEENGIALAVVEGETINIQVASVSYDVSARTGSFTVQLSLEVPGDKAANDFFNSRIEIPAPAAEFAGTVFDASSEPSEPLPSPEVNQTLWWSIRAPEDGVLSLSLIALNFSPVLTVFEGSELSLVTGVPALRAGQYRLAGGHEYPVQLASSFTPAGNFTLRSRFYALTNDSFAAAIRLEGTNAIAYANLSAATAEVGEPIGHGTNTVWVSWAAPGTGHVDVKCARPICIFTGQAVDQLSAVRTLRSSPTDYSFLAEEGVVYHFQISEENSQIYSPETTIEIALKTYGESGNDNFANANQLPWSLNALPPGEWLAIGRAGLEPGEPEHSGVVNPKSIWYRWQAPVTGHASFSLEYSLTTNVLIEVYEGSALASLNLLTNGIDSVKVKTKGGQNYSIAAIVPEDVIGEIVLTIRGDSDSYYQGTFPVPGNLLREPSWEETNLQPQFWKTSGSIGGYVREPGGCDGVTWPALSHLASIWQDIPTVAGRSYKIQFACMINARTEDCCEARVNVLWDSESVGSVSFGNQKGRWIWGDFTATAVTNLTRLKFANAGIVLDMDSFSVVELNAPPEIARQPTSISAPAGVTAAFVAGVTGSEPLFFQWFLDDAPLPGETKQMLILESISLAQSGSYRLSVSNAFGSTMSAPCTLSVLASSAPTILQQPYGGDLAVGEYVNLAVVAIGDSPLQYQWSKNGSSIAGAVGRVLTFPSVAETDAGKYEAVIQNLAGSVRSIPVSLQVHRSSQSGGTVMFANGGPEIMDAPILDVDGVTPLHGTNFVAQLYAGPEVEMIGPAGEPSHFQSGFSAGLFDSHIISLPTVAPGSNAIVQVRVWDSTKASSFEEARALGGKYGKSEYLNIIAGGDLIPPIPPAVLAGLKGFSLQVGVAPHASGRIFVFERQRDLVTWSHEGEVGFRYVVEKSFGGFVWRPFVIVTNSSATVFFSDTVDSETTAAFYRSRSLD